MAERAKRRRLAKELEESNVPAPSSITLQSSYASATLDDKRNWKGFCEVESEPVCNHLAICILMNFAKLT